MEWNKGILMDISGGYWKACALHTGVRLDVFTRIGTDDSSAEDLAVGLDGDLRGITALLNALAAMDLLKKTGDRFSNTPFSEQFLSKDSPDYTGYILMHHHHLMTSWARLPDAVLSGRPNRISASHTEKEVERESFLMGMFNIASETAPRYAALPAVSEILSGCRKMLDFGGGPGTFAIHFCRTHPDLAATVFDLPTTRKFAEKTIASFGLSERIRFAEGSYLEGSLPLEREYDMAWLSHILHGEGPDTAQSIVAKAAGCLRPGGRLLIHEFILDNTLDGPVFPALFNLNMLAGTDNGQAYSDAHLKEMLASCGMTEIRRIEMETPNGAGIIMGRLPA